MAAPAFTVQNVEQLSPFIQATADAKLKEMMKSPTKLADLVASFALPMASEIIYRMLGIPLSDMQKLSEFNAIRTNGSSTATQASTANQELLNYLTGLVEQKAASGSLQQDRDIISTLVREQLRPGHLKLEELVQMTFLLLVAGNATMVSMIALGVVTFLQHPEQLKQVRADPTLMSNAARELCRFHTASALATRE
jgi:fungal nitric oxide reductase